MKPPFRNIDFTNKIIFNPRGNKLAYLAPMAIIVNDKKACEEKYQEDYDRAKEIYDQHINPGQKFKAKDNDDIICKILHVNPKSQTVSWKQINFNQNKIWNKGAAGKWPILGFIQMVQTNQIKLL